MFCVEKTQDIHNDMSTAGVSASCPIGVFLCRLTDTNSPSEGEKFIWGTE